MKPFKNGELRSNASFLQYAKEACKMGNIELDIFSQAYMIPPIELYNRREELGLSQKVYLWSLFLSDGKPGVYCHINDKWLLVMASYVRLSDKLPAKIGNALFIFRENSKSGIYREWDSVKEKAIQLQVSKADKIFNRSSTRARSRLKQIALAAGNLRNLAGSKQTQYFEKILDEFDGIAW